MAYAGVFRFELDTAKDVLNRAQHGIGLDEAVAVFRSRTPWLELDDEEHGGDELRYRAIGPTTRGVHLVVCTDRDEDTVRIISARKATPRECRLYEAWIERYL